MRATARWAFADLRTHRGQALSIVLATAGITAALLLSAALLVYAANPWQRLFTSTQGAHVWLRTTAAADVGALRKLDGVSALSGPYLTEKVTLRHGADKAAADIRATGSTPPQVGRPRLAAGHWRVGPGEIVLEKSMATALWAQPGDTLSIGAGGAEQRVRVVGVAQTAETRYAPDSGPGISWASPSVVRSSAGASLPTGQTVGLRLSDPADTAFMVQRAVTAVGSDQVVSVATWQEARADAEGDNQLLGLLLGLFGVGALLAAAIAVTGGVSSRVQAYGRDISVLKAVGFTPGQIVQMFLIQHAALATAGVVLGATATETLATRSPGQLSAAMTLWQGLPEHTWALPGTAVTTVLAIAVATVLAAWRAGRVPAIPAARIAAPGRRRMSGAARAVLRRRVPPALVLGCRGVLHRPWRSAVAVVRLALPLMMIAVALGAWATLDRIQHHPAQVGLAGQLTIRPSGLPDDRIRELLSRQPGIAAVEPGIELAALAPGQTETVTLRGMGTAARPYPFAVAEGRAPSGPAEAVAGQGLLDALHVTVGSWVRVTVGGTPHVLHIVGRSIEMEDGGRVLSTSYDTLRVQDASVRPSYYAPVLRPGARSDAVRQALTHASHGTLEVRDSAAPAEQFTPMRGVIAGLVAVLALITLAELSTEIAAGIRNHAADFRAYRSIGLSPRQSVATMVTSIGILASAAAVTGAALGAWASRWLIDLQARHSGVGSGLAVPPSWAALTLLVGTCLAAAVAACVLPVRRAIQEQSMRVLRTVQ
ncbi:FtsX-like permease family protein [Streptomyces sp. NPDC005962]|uniref:FtsX-like permease family protein n=1 Tax=Streptomyces sp. NPDC005962 TaxID=3154466 RepID=UPI0033CA04D9